MEASPAFSVEARDILGLMHKSIEQGVSVKALLADLGLPLDLLDDPATLVDMEDCWRLIAANQNAIHEESLLLSSRPLKRGTTRLILSNLNHCRDLKEGLESLAETYNVIHGGDYNFVRKWGNFLSYMVDDSDFHYRVQPNVFAIEFALLKIHCAVCCLAGRQLKLVRVATKRKQLPTHERHYLQLFNGKVLVDQPHYELVYSGEQAALPLQTDKGIDVSGNIYADYLSLWRDQQAIDDDHFVQKVMQYIRREALRGVRSQELVAAAIGMSVATLRRKLESRDTNFRLLQDRVNNEIAVNCLCEQMPPVEVAEKLGYSDVRSFKRAFKRWHGLSPADYLTRYQQHQ